MEINGKRYLDGPDRLYLQGDAGDGRTWCEDAIDGHEDHEGVARDTPYIRADVADATLAQLQADYGPSHILCHNCGGAVVEFSVPNDHWNAVMRPDGEHNREYICLACWLKKSAAHYAALQAENAGLVEALTLGHRELSVMLETHPDRRGGKYEAAYLAMSEALGKPLIAAVSTTTEGGVTE